MTTQWPPAGPPGYGYGYLVPAYEQSVVVARPPRPGVVNIAVILTYLGAGLALARAVINIISTFMNKSEITSQLNEGFQDEWGSLDRSSVVTRVFLGVVVGGAILQWLNPAAVAVVTAALSARGANPARIVLAVMMGVYALFDVCSGTSGLVSAVGADARGSSLNAVVAGLDALLAGLAVTIGVLLLVPSANRFFSAGPGRRFAPLS